MYLKLVDLSDRAGSIYLGKYYNEDIVHTLMEDELSVFMTDAWVEDKGLQNIAAFQTFPQFFLLAKRYGIPYERITAPMPQPGGQAGQPETDGSACRYCSGVTPYCCLK